MLIYSEMVPDIAVDFKLDSFDYFLMIIIDFSLRSASSQLFVSFLSSSWRRHLDWLVIMTRCYQEIATSKVSNLERQNKREIRKLRLDGQGWGSGEKPVNGKEREECILIKKKHGWLEISVCFLVTRKIMRQLVFYCIFVFAW